MQPRYLIFVLLLATALGAGAFLALRMQEPVEPRAALLLPAATPVPEFSLLDQDGSAIDSSVFAGHWNLVFFGFTHCPDVCPTTLQVLATARDALAARGQQPLVRIVLVSVDPERDTPARMAQYVNHFGDGNLGITGSLEQTRILAAGLGIYFEKQAGDDVDYSVDHSAAVLVIGPDGRLRAVFGGPHVADDFVHDLPLLFGSS